MGGVDGRSGWAEWMGGEDGRSGWAERMGGVDGRRGLAERMGGVDRQKQFGEHVGKQFGRQSQLPNAVNDLEHACFLMKSQSL